MSNKDNVLDKLLGVPGKAAKIRKGTSGITQTLQKQGFQHKALAEDVNSKLDEIKTMLSDDPGLATQILQYMMSMGGTEPDGDEGTEDMAVDDGSEPMAEMEEEYMEADDEEETKEADDEEEAEPATKARKADQPGYGAPAQSGPTQAINGAITKKPGNFPKPIPPQTDSGNPPKVGKKRGKELSSSEILTALKEFNSQLSDIKEALGELADVPERINALEAMRALAPRQASVDPSSAVTDKNLIAGVKKAITMASKQYDPFWGGNVAPNLEGKE